MIVVDLTTMPEGERYEDRYGRWIEVFDNIAHTPALSPITVRNAPWSWHALLRYLGCHTDGGQVYFPQDQIAAEAQRMYIQHDRHLLEVLCALRPETVDALWKVDAQWQSKRVRLFPRESAFPVTCNGSFWRPEVMDFIRNDLGKYVPTKRKVVLVPCAADKPYPARMHAAVMKLLPDDWYLCNVTGVLGLVPQDLWDVMPHYDSGIPNEWRAQNTVRDYFARFPHDRIVSYSDFYSVPIANGLKLAGIEHAEFVIEPRFYADYLPLHWPFHLEQLRRVIEGQPQFQKGLV